MESPSFPILNTEYENPLFLKLACEYYKDKNKIFEQSLNISELFNNVIDTVNINLSKAKKFDFDQNLDVVYEVIQKIIELIHHSDYRELKYKDAYKNINDVAKEYVQRPEKFLEALIDENILTKSKNYNEEMIVYFSYERMGDYL
ncbi:ATP-binding protein, partial [Staphylococcus devriesei]